MACQSYSFIDQTCNRCWYRSLPHTHWSHLLCWYRCSHWRHLYSYGTCRLPRLQQGPHDRHMPFLRQDAQPNHVDWYFLQRFLHRLPDDVPREGRNHYWYFARQHHLLAQRHRGHLLPIHRAWRQRFRLLQEGRVFPPYSENSQCSGMERRLVWWPVWFGIHYVCHNIYSD